MYMLFMTFPATAHKCCNSDFLCLARVDFGSFKLSFPFNNMTPITLGLSGANRQSVAVQLPISAVFNRHSNTN
ncbi:MAG TPA: hypothetical protein VN369_01285, partial [Terriglobales bacterium]|nr:hypothetical protein [Terriglobales bacterium]